MGAKRKLKAVGSDYLTKLNSVDGWQNQRTGMGIHGRDKGQSIEFGADVRLDMATLDEMGRADGLANNIIEYIVNDAMRSGWVINFESDDENEITPEKSLELNKQLQAWYKETRFKARVSQHLKQSRQYGGSLLTLGAFDGQPASKPLDPAKVKTFDWFRAHDRFQVSPSSEIDSDPSSIGFGMPEFYTLHSAHALQLGSEGDKRMLDTAVHNSRMWRTDGTILSDRVRIQNGGWGDSVLEVCNEPLGNHGAAMKSTRTIVQEWVQGVFKIKNLQGIINANGPDEVRQRFHLMDYLRSVWQSVIVDTDNEDYERKVVTAAGLPEVLDRFMVHLSAVARMPMTLLFGVSPGGFGTGEAEGDNWDDRVKAYQTDFVEPLLEYVLGILFQTPEFKSFPSTWSVKFNSLQLTDPVEEADIRLKTSQADALDVQSGILDPDEPAESHYGGANYSTEIVLNREARDGMDAALEAGGGPGGSGGIGVPESGVSVIGENLSDVLGVLKDVTAKALTVTEAELVLVLAYPGIDPAELKKLVAEAAKAEPPSAPTSSGSQFGGGSDSGQEPSGNDTEQDPEPEPDSSNEADS